ncbi:hypothetical protein PRUPE_8G173600 [Prunus persica]|uniref:Uncharacterized protein n=1 Tax=Prunus persica TaxID=3760 RepID=A0A251MZA9_PRUPE|nr:hypothetical protein PRUPE_8G173600 [Prunus persica]
MYQLRSLHACVSNYRPLTFSLDLPNSLKYLSWKAYHLKYLPSKFSAQNLVGLDLSYSQVVGQFWNEDQSPWNLKWINLSGCKHITEVPNLSRSLKIECIILHNCASLVEIPSYFQHLGKLTNLCLGHCTNLKNLPEMPCNLEILYLSLTAIEELPKSVWSHEKISHLDIAFCKHLKSLPSNTCKLKVSSSFSLVGCESLCEFWELPRDTTVLEFSSTRIKELRNESIESVVGLTAIKLTNCKSLVSLPMNIWKLKYLESLNLSEISEAMEHLEFLNLSGTMVKEVPKSIGNLVALRKLHMVECSIQEIPDDLFCLTSLQELNLSLTEIKSIRASVKQAAQLSRLCLNGCESLESLPELPPLLQCLEAKDCVSLKTVSSSSTALAQGWEKYIFSRGLHEKHIFSDCRKLDENARSNIFGDAQLRIMRMATASSEFKEGKIEQPSYDSDSYGSYDDFVEELLRQRSFVGNICCGNEIPNWFSHKNFLGFAVSLVVAYKRGYALSFVRWFRVGCKYNFKTSNGKSREVNHPWCNLLTNTGYRDSPEVFLWCYNNVFEEVVEGAHSPTAFYKFVTEVNVDFTVQSYDGYEEEEELEVKKCGICLLYGKGAEMIKQRALYAQDF